MKPGAKALLNHLQEPPKYRDSFNIKVRRFYTDMSGTIIDKSLVPAIIQQKFPVMLFGQFDHNGGYRNSQQVKQPLNSYYLYTFTPFTFFDYFFFQFGNDIKNQLKPGDVVQLYTNNTTTPTYLIWIILSNDFQSYAALTANTISLPLQLTEILLTYDNVANYTEPIGIIKCDQLGYYKTTHYNPLAFKTVDTVLQDFIRIPFNIKISQYVGFTTYMQFTTDIMILNLKFKLT